MESMWWPVLGALIGAALGVVTGWIEKPRWAKERPGALIALVVGLAVVGALIGVGADRSTGNGDEPDDPGGGGGGSTWAQAWTGGVTVPNNRFLELDSIPPHSVQGEGSGTELLYGNMAAKGMELYPATDFSEVSGQDVSDPVTCDESVSTAPAGGAVPPEEGQVFCLHTSQDRLAMLTVTSSAYDAVAFQVIVWRRG